MEPTIEQQSLFPLLDQQFFQPRTIRQIISTLIDTVHGLRYIADYLTASFNMSGC